MTDQNKIINTLEEHFKEVFSNHDSGEDPDGFIGRLNLLTVNQQEANELGELISLDEVTKVLRNMTNNKSPGSDCFQPEFFIYFWRELRFFVLRMFRVF